MPHHHSSHHHSHMHHSSMHHHGGGVPMIPGTMAFTIQMAFLMVAAFVVGIVMLLFFGSIFGSCVLIPAIILVIVGVVFLVVVIWSWRVMKAGGPPQQYMQQPGQPPYYQQPGQQPYYQPPPGQPYNQQPPPPGVPPSPPPPY